MPIPTLSSVSSGKPKLLDQVRQTIRRKHYSLRTELKIGGGGKPSPQSSPSGRGRGRPATRTQDACALTRSANQQFALPPKPRSNHGLRFVAEATCMGSTGRIEDLLRKSRILVEFCWLRSRFWSIRSGFWSVRSEFWSIRSGFWSIRSGF